MKLKKYFPFLINIFIILMGSINFIFSKAISGNPVIYFYVEILVISLLYLILYLLNKKDKTNLYVFIFTLVSFLTSIFIKKYPNHIILAIAMLILTISILIVRIIKLKKTYQNKIYMFYIDTTIMSVTFLIGLLVIINLYFKISPIYRLLGFYFVIFGTLNLISLTVSYMLEKYNIVKVRKPINIKRNRE